MKYIKVILNKRRDKEKMKSISFEEVNNLDKTEPNSIVMVLFGHSRCGYCPYAKQSLSQLENEESNLKAYYCDTIVNPKAITFFDIKSVPYVIIVVSGVVVQIISGSKTVEEYRQILNLIKNKLNK